MSAVRGVGLLNALVMPTGEEAAALRAPSAWDVCVRLASNGLLAKPTQGHVIRFAPPLCINETHMSDAVEIVRATLLSYNT